MSHITKRIQRTEGLIKAAAGIIAILPSAAVLTGLVDIPPDLGDLLRYVSLATTLAIILAVVILTRQIRRLSAGWTTLIVSLAIILGIASALSYLLFSRSHVIIIHQNNETRRFVTPLSPSSDLRELVEPFGGDYVEALETSVQKETIVRLLDEESGTSIALMTVLMVLAQALITGGIMLGAWKLSGGDQAKGTVKRRPPTTKAKAHPPQ